MKGSYEMKRRHTGVLFFVFIIVSLSVAATFFLSLNTDKSSPKVTAPKLKSSDKIWVISDLHHLAAELFDDGSQFQFIKDTAAGKDLDYSQERLETLVWQVEKEQPKVLLVSGDLTLNGEKASAQELATYFQRIKELGTAVYVIPGNHDVASGWARKYTGDEATPVAQILPTDFAEIFAEMGYAEAFSRDENSLSYAVQPFSDLVFVMLDTNKYVNEKSKSRPQVSGRLRPETQGWFSEVVTQAQSAGALVIPVMHHNLMDHNTVVNKGFTIDEPEKIQQLFFEANLPLVLSGHIHAQSITTLKQEQQKIHEIVTSSFASLSNPIGEMTINKEQINYRRQTLQVEKWAAQQQLTDPRLLGYRDYSESLFYQDGEGMAYRTAYDEGWFDEVKTPIVADFVGRMNVRYFEGFYSEDWTTSVAELKEEEGYLLLAAQPESFLTAYIQSMFLSENLEDRAVTIPINQETERKE